MIFEKNRFEVWNLQQHPYRHSLAEFSYANSALPSGYANAEDALNYIRDTKSKCHRYSRCDFNKSS